MKSRSGQQINKTTHGSRPGDCERDCLHATMKLRNRSFTELGSPIQLFAVFAIRRRLTSGVFIPLPQLKHTLHCTYCDRLHLVPPGLVNSSHGMAGAVYVSGAPWSQQHFSTIAISCKENFELILLTCGRHMSNVPQFSPIGLIVLRWTNLWTWLDSTLMIHAEYTFCTRVCIILPPIQLTFSVTIVIASHWTGFSSRLSSYVHYHAAERT